MVLICADDPPPRRVFRSGFGATLHFGCGQRGLILLSAATIRGVNRCGGWWLWSLAY
jgi:hypothetical protein